MSIELKIKSKHLGEEARVIRHEEQKLKKQSAWYENLCLAMGQRKGSIPGNAKTIVVGGKEYSSLRKASEGTGISLYLLRKQLNEV